MSYSGEVLADAPVAYYRMNEAGSPDVVDNFNRADENPIATNWSGPFFPGDGQLRIISNQLRGDDGHGSGFSGSWYDVTTYTDFQAEVTVVTKPTTNGDHVLIGRFTSPGGSFDGYAAHLERVSGSDHIWIDRFDDAAQTVIAGSGAITFNNGDRLGIIIQGSTIIGLINGVKAVSVVDTTYSGPGSIAVEIQHTGAGITLDDFRAGASLLPKDSSGNGNHMTDVIGAHTFGVAGAIASDPADTAISGTDDYFTAPDHATLDFGDVVTFEAWIKRGVTGSFEECIVGKGANSGGLYILNDALMLAKGAVGSVMNSAAVLTSTTDWYHVVATKDGATAHLYINGENADGTLNNFTFVDGDGVLSIGAELIPGPGSFYTGAIDEVAVYDYALSVERVEAHYTAAAVTGLRHDRASVLSWLGR